MNKIDKDVVKRIFAPVINIILSIISGMILMSIVYYILYNLYLLSFRYPNKLAIINLIGNFLNDIKYTIGDIIYLIIAMMFIIPIYILITYKDTKTLVEILRDTEKMADGELDKTIDVNSNTEIGRLAKNINSIVYQLKDVTIEEKKAQQTKTDLITNVSHDLRTPLTSIIGYLNLIEEDKYKDEVELRYYTNIAYEKSQSLKILIDDLFELTKMQNKTMPINKMDLNLVELVSQVIYQFEYQFKEENMECRTYFSDDKLIINADPNKLVRCFENLITNAIKYGKEGKYIDIVTDKVENLAVIKIINYGDAIPQIELPYIFDRFYRVEKSRNSSIGGSGLGLPIAKNIIELHEGNIFVESTDIETVFKIEIPLI